MTQVKTQMKKILGMRKKTFAVGFVILLMLSGVNIFKVSVVAINIGVPSPNNNTDTDTSHSLNMLQHFYRMGWFNGLAAE